MPPHPKGFLQQNYERLSEKYANTNDSCCRINQLLQTVTPPRRIPTARIKIKNITLPLGVPIAEVGKSMKDTTTPLGISDCRNQIIVKHATPPRWIRTAKKNNH